MPRRYVQLDVFASRPGAGNPLAVVLDAEGLDDAETAGDLEPGGLLEEGKTPDQWDDEELED